MKKALRYNELDVCWDEYISHLHENPQDEDFAEDDETGAGIFGNELNHEQNAQKGYCTCISNGTVYGHGEKDEIERVIFNLLEPFKDYHFEFKFFEAK